MSLRTAIDELHEALESSAQSYGELLAGELEKALGGQAEVHLSDDTGSQGETEIWVQAERSTADLKSKVERVIKRALGKIPGASADITSTDEDGIIITVRRVSAKSWN
jgi:hypothetical protein